MTTDPAEDREPRTNYSERGLIVFSSNRNNGDFEIYTMDSEGGSQKRVVSRPGHDRRPDWSPRQTQIVFEGQADNSEELYVMNSDGSNLVRITNTPGYRNTQPAWTSNIRFPAGDTDALTDIAFVSNRDGGDLEIYVTKPDGSDQRRLTSSPRPDQSPAWSPDGTRIAFLSERDGNREIYIMNADGSGQMNLTNNAHADEAPIWSANGDRISFSTDREGEMKTYSMRPDGSDQSISPRQR